MKNAILRGTSRFRAHFRSAWRSFVAFAAFALTGGTLFAAPGPYEADTTGEPEQYEGYVLSWSDEFNVDGAPNPANWGYELGYVRNGEAQKYTKSLDNAVVGNGALHIYGRKEADGTYTSASLISKGLRHFKYGRYEFRAKVPISGGAWPVLWMMGAKYSWPACGEIDIMEYYSGIMHANWCWGADHGSYSPWGDGSSNALWDFSIDYLIKGGEYRGSTFPANADFFNQFHVWRMDWTSEKCTIYIDGIKVNEQTLDDTLNLEGYEPESVGKSPFREPQYILMDIAMGTKNGGAIDDSALPMVMEVDYVRCYRLAGDDHKDEGMIVPPAIDMTPGEGEIFYPVTTEPTAPAGYHLAWNDEFDDGDTPSASNWSMEEGSTEYVANGVLVMPMTNATGSLTWGGLDSAAGRTFTKGVMEIRARLPMARGSTVFLTTSTAEGADPYGYVELLDFGWSAASPFIGGWVECPGVGDWFDIGFETLRETNDKWAAQFHVWRYIVDDEAATVTLDGRQLYRKPISQLSSIGKDALPHNLAFWVGTDDVSLSDPLIGHGLEIDYVRVYEPGEEEDPQVDPPAAANRIVMVGDSITVQSYRDGNGNPISWGFSNRMAGKLPGVTIVPLGWSGQTLSGWKGAEEAARGGAAGQLLETGYNIGTELDKAADAIFVMLGMNDLLRPTTYDSTDSIATWKADLKALAQSLKAREAGKNATIYIASVTLLTEDLNGPKNQMLDKLATAAQQVVSELGEGYVYVPVRENAKAFFQAARAAHPEFHMSSDFVHPVEGGHAVIASSYLTALGKTSEAAVFEAELEGIVNNAKKNAPDVYIAPDPAPWLVSDKAFSLQYAWNYPALDDTTASGAIETAIEAGKTPAELLTVDTTRLSGWTSYVSTIDYPGGATDGSICYNKLFNAAPFSAAYAARYVYSPTERTVTLSVTKENFSACPYVAIWINGTKVHAGQEVTKEVTLAKGNNLVYVRSSQTDSFWQQSVSFTGTGASDLLYGTAPLDPIDLNETTSFDDDKVSVVGAAKADRVTVGDDETIAFTYLANGKITFTEDTKVDILVVGGGAGGGFGGGGGGGAGGVRFIEGVDVTAGTYDVTIGQGGAGSTDQLTLGSNGGSSSVFGYEALGGGGGGSAATRNGANGASGGGAAGMPSFMYGNGWTQVGAGAGTDGQGYAGGTGTDNQDNSCISGGGGGAGGVGASASTSPEVVGKGGRGVACTITGKTVYYGGGGAGARTDNMGTILGGAGGGGNAHGWNWNDAAQTQEPVPGENGVDGLGGGGGGGSSFFFDGSKRAAGGKGGSGVVIVRYYLTGSGEDVDPDDPGTGDSGVTATGATVTKVGDDEVFSFLGNGTIKLTEAKTVEVLLVGGGGGGGCHGGGGGGAGGVVHLETLQVAAGEYPIVVGLGGLGSQSQDYPGANGGDSTVFGYKAFGGGGGGSIFARNGVMGASGGGAAGTPGGQILYNNWAIGVPGAGMVGQGFAGGMAAGTRSTPGKEEWQHDSAGGGGAGSVGGFAKGGVLGAGGDGIECAIVGTNVWYGGGGGGGVTGGTAGVDGGKGGGGAGHGYDYVKELEGHESDMVVAGDNGVNGLGGGGGGGGGYFHHHPANGGNGGSGIVIVRVLANPASAGDEPSPSKPLPPAGSISAFGSRAGYDGGGNHYIRVEADEAKFTVQYRTPDDAEWSDVNPHFVNVCDTSVWYRVTSADYETVIGSAYVIITQANNRWWEGSQPAVGNWFDGETPSIAFPWPVFGGGYTVTYSGTKDDGTPVSGEFPVTTEGDHTDDFPALDPGNYKVSFTVAETTNWTGLSTDFMFSIWNDATIRTVDGFTITKHLMGILNPDDNWKLVPFEDVKSLATALAHDKTGTWSETAKFAVDAGYISETVGDFNYEGADFSDPNNITFTGATDGGFPGGRWQQEGHTLLESTATIIVPAAGAYTFSVGMPEGSDFALEITGHDATFTMGMDDYDVETHRAVKTFVFPEAGEYTLELDQFRAENGTYLEFSYAPGEVAAEDFSTSTFSLVGKTAMMTQAEPDIPEYEGYTLAWNDEFNENGAPNPANWSVTTPGGTVVCTNGSLVLTATSEDVQNDETYAELTTAGLRTFMPGRYEVRMKSTYIDGFHSCLILKGTDGEYPHNGCYNFVDTEYSWVDDGGRWETVAKGIAQWAGWGENKTEDDALDWWSAKDITPYVTEDPDWESKFHVWTLDWTDEKMTTSIDGEVVWEKPISELSDQGYSPFADPDNPFTMTVAFGRRQIDSRGALPQTMEVDYIRYYVPTSEDGDAFPKVDDVETTTADEFVAAVKSGSTVTLPEGGDFAWDGNVLKKGDETWATLPDYYTVGEGGVISFAVDAVKPVISAIAADAAVKVTVSNAKKGLTYGLLSATTLEGLATATPAWLSTPATDDGKLDIPAGDKGTAGFFKAVVTDQVPAL